MQVRMTWLAAWLLIMIVLGPGSQLSAQPKVLEKPLVSDLIPWPEPGGCVDSTCDPRLSPRPSVPSVERAAPDDHFLLVADRVNAGEPWAVDQVGLGGEAIPTLGVTALALLTSALLVLGLALLRWRTEP